MRLAFLERIVGDFTLAKRAAVFLLERLLG